MTTRRSFLIGTGAALAIPLLPLSIRTLDTQTGAPKAFEQALKLWHLQHPWRPLKGVQVFGYGASKGGRSCWAIRSLVWVQHPPTEHYQVRCEAGQHVIDQAGPLEQWPGKWMPMAGILFASPIRVRALFSPRGSYDTATGLASSMRHNFQDPQDLMALDRCRAIPGYGHKWAGV